MAARKKTGRSKNSTSLVAESRQISGNGRKRAERPAHSTPSQILAYNDGQAPSEKQICAALAKLIDEGLPNAEKKVWHGHPVWFDDGNPLVGYAVRKSGVQLLFWSGRAFDEPDLLPE